MPQDVLPFVASYWAVPTNLLAGAFPNDHFEDESTQILERMLDLGIRHIINLTDSDESNCRGDYFPDMTRLAAQRKIEVVFRQFPIPDRCVPSVEHMQMILDDIDDALLSQRPVYVHCWGGRGRTGTVVGCLLARNGVAMGDDCLKMMADLRRDASNGHRESPETEEQREFVRQWKQGQ